MLVENKERKPLWCSVGTVLCFHSEAQSILLAYSLGTIAEKQNEINLEEIIDL